MNASTLTLPRVLSRPATSVRVNTIEAPNSSGVIVDILQTFADRLNLETQLLVAGRLEHSRGSWGMQAAYAHTSNGQYGYAYTDLSSFRVPPVQVSAAEYLSHCDNVSLKLATLDASWRIRVQPLDSKRLNGQTVAQRDLQRARFMARAIRLALVGTDIKRICMFGCFESLQQILESLGYDVWCCDDGRGLTFPQGCSLQEIAESTVLIATASYLTRNDFALIQDLAHRSPLSILIAQTCHNMVEYHWDSGFRLVCSESFPPLSFGKSVIGVYAR